MHIDDLSNDELTVVLLFLPITSEYLNYMLVNKHLQQLLDTSHDPLYSQIAVQHYRLSSDKPSHYRTWHQYISDFLTKRFCSQKRDDKIVLSNHNKTATNEGSVFALALLEKPIPRNGTYSITFTFDTKPPNSGYTVIGVLSRKSYEIWRNARTYIGNIDSGAVGDSVNYLNIGYSDNRYFTWGKAIQLMKDCYSQAGDEFRMDINLSDRLPEVVQNNFKAHAVFNSLQQSIDAMPQYCVREYDEGENLTGWIKFMIRTKANQRQWQQIGPTFCGIYHSNSTEEIYVGLNMATSLTVTVNNTNL